MEAFVETILTFFNVLLAAYFIAGNGTYTVLMLISLGSVWLHNRRRSYEGLQQLRDSPATPPATVIIAAWNEQDVIVGAVRSVLGIEYPGIQICVVDDGSSDETLERLHGRLQPEFDVLDLPAAPARPPCSGLLR